MRCHPAQGRMVARRCKPCASYGLVPWRWVPIRAPKKARRSAGPQGWGRVDAPGASTIRFMARMLDWVHHSPFGPHAGVNAAFARKGSSMMTPGYVIEAVKAMKAVKFAMHTALRAR